MHRIATDSYGSFATLPELVHAASEAPLMDREEERRLMESVQRGKTGALDTVLEAHLRLVVDEAIRYRGHFQRTGELVTMGLRGLRRAALRFDPDAHGRFWGYARPWVREEMRGIERPT